VSSSTLFLNLGARWGGWLTARTIRCIPEKENRQVRIVHGAGLAAGRSGRERKTSPRSGFDRRTIRLVANPYTDYAISAYIIAGTKNIT